MARSIAIGKAFPFHRKFERKKKIVFERKRFSCRVVLSTDLPTRLAFKIKCSKTYLDVRSSDVYWFIQKIYTFADSVHFAMYYNLFLLSVYWDYQLVILRLVEKKNNSNRHLDIARRSEEKNEKKDATTISDGNIKKKPISKRPSISIRSDIIKSIFIISTLLFALYIIINN